jgi:Icc protein
MPVLAHISDLHLDGEPTSLRRATRTMTYLNHIRELDAIVVTGDIAANGTDAEYRSARTILDSAHPVAHCPGNHDDRAAYRRSFLGGDGDGLVNRVWDVSGLLLVLCDSTVPGELAGTLGAGTLDWLDRTLTTVSPGKPAVVGLHHPPVPLASPIMDPIRLTDADGLAEVITGQPRVAAVLCGHAHSAAAATFAGRPLRVASGVISTLGLPWLDAPAFDRQAPVQVAFHVLTGDGGFITHYRVVPETDREDTAIDG